MSRPWNTSTRIIVLVLALIVLAIVAYEISPLIGPLVIAGLLAYTLNLVVRFVANRSSISRKLIANVVYFLFMIALIATPGTLVPIAVGQAQNLGEELEQIGRDVEAFLEEPIVIMDREIPLDQLWSDLTSVTTDFGSAFGGALAVVETTSTNFVRLVIIIVITYYLMMDWQGLRRWLINLLPEGGRSDCERLLTDIDRIWRAYMQGTLALMLIVALVFIIVGLAIGLPGAIAVGIVTGILSTIPEVGPWIAGAIAVAIAFFAGSNYLPISNIWFAIIVGAIYLVLTQVKSIWLRPQVMGRFMHMNTGVVFLAIIAAVMLQGILAALIILPVLASAGVLGKYTRAKMLNLDPWPETSSTAAEAAAGAAAEVISPAAAEESVDESKSKSWRSA